MTTKTKAIVIGTFVALLAIAGVIAARAEAKQPGDACETYQSSACSGEGGACLVTGKGQYCSHSCKTNADCPAKWSCDDVKSETYSGKTGDKVASNAVKMCLRP